MTCNLLLWLLYRLLGRRWLLRLSNYLAPNWLLTAGWVVYGRRAIRVYKWLTWNKLVFNVFLIVQQVPKEDTEGHTYCSILSYSIFHYVAALAVGDIYCGDSGLIRQPVKSKKSYLPPSKSPDCLWISEPNQLFLPALSLRQ